jgi:hypothetical protein
MEQHKAINGKTSHKQLFSRASVLLDGAQLLSAMVLLQSLETANITYLY